MAQPEAPADAGRTRRRHRRRGVPVRAITTVLALLVGGGLLAWWLRPGPVEPGSAAPPPRAALPSSAVQPQAQTGSQEPADLDLAASEPVEDSVYPRVGEPDIDALHYDLNLAWDPRARVLTGVATLLFRAPADAAEVHLDLAPDLAVGTVTLDGEPVGYEHRGTSLVLDTPVTVGTEHTAVIEYAGTAGPYPAPTARGDFSATGWTVEADGVVWTMQEPYGAFTWYPVNDQPSDKAYYDVTITVPEPWVGVSGGVLVDRRSHEGDTVTHWRLTKPAASYLTTIGIGPYVSQRLRGPDGLPVTNWVLRQDREALRGLRFVPRAVSWIERRLGPYPFDTAGVLLTDSISGMETQTLVTLGNTDYTLSREVIVHEFVHQWYGDAVTPTDWRDLWLNEGMAMLLQLVYRAETAGVSVDTALDTYGLSDQEYRDLAGPPGRYDPAMFAASNVYLCPARMWNELRKELGDEEFWRIARAWVAEHAPGNVDRQQLYDFWSAETGRELRPFFRAWIMGRTTPAPGVPSGGGD